MNDTHADRWLETPLGVALLEAEQRLVGGKGRPAQGLGPGGRFLAEEDRRAGHPPGDTGVDGGARADGPLGTPPARAASKSSS